jgi:hypothetical protein
MQATQFPNIVALVEGEMEKMFVNANFHYVHVITINNGSGWTLEAMCRQIESKFSVLDYKPDHIIVWIDKERQSCSSSDYKDKIVASLVSAGAEEEKISVCIPNQMTENIILADELLIRAEFSIPEYAYDFEGKNGKAILKSIYKSLNQKYLETFHGVRLLKKMRLDRAARSSKSAFDFRSCFNFDCWWLTE